MTRAQPPRQVGDYGLRPRTETHVCHPGGPVGARPPPARRAAQCVPTVLGHFSAYRGHLAHLMALNLRVVATQLAPAARATRSEERRVGKECRSLGAPDD